MKKNYLYTLVLVFSLVTAVAFLYQYKGKQEAVPPLKERHGPISTSSEWLNTKAAIQGLQRNLREKPNDHRSKLFLALAYMQEARITGDHPYYYPAALKLIDEVLEDNPEEPVMEYEATVAKASIQLSLHQFDKALETGKAALAINNRGAAVYGVLCDAYVELGQYEDAIAMADQMTALRPDLKSYSRVSYLREIHGDLPGAIEAMEAAVRAGFPGLEQTAWSQVTLGHLYEKTGDLTKAEFQYQKALSQYNQYAFALSGLGRIALKKGQRKAAQELFVQAANTLPEFTFQEELVRIYVKQGQNAKAAETLEELIAGMEEDQEAGHIVDLELANIHLELKKDYATALEYALKEYERRPDNIDVNKTLANIYYHQQNYAKASAHIQKATRTNSQDAELLCLNGLIAYKTNKLADGQHLIRKSFTINPYQLTPLSVEGKSLLSSSLSKI
ncbi:tetratricopeptide repeat protein [Rufibacter sediminis]|uniref:Tetratricopeptide repeat protein n=1 Tax=Rufibacter sediminis TaxID=2762756 RepID=A0ABR6VXU6_9BACT|nr:tetratricopeptide repeat protein [Rufibacter sediminis]MBC3541628.1 tetratricopeptide repeat protein [Rufibacter sediminis]